MKSHYTDQELLKFMKSNIGQRLVYEYLLTHRDLRNKSFAKIFYSVKDIVTANEIFLESLANFFEKVAFDEFEQRSSIQTYIVSTCRNLSLKFIEQRRKQNENNIEYIRRLSLELNNNFEYFNQERYQYESKLFRKIVRKISEKCRKYLRLFYRKGLRIKEIAEILNRSESAIKKRGRNCKDELRDIIKADTEVYNEIKKRYGK